MIGHGGGGGGGGALSKCSKTQHSSLYETMKSSQPEFYANTSLLFQVLCRKHDIYMYSGEYLTEL